MRASCRAGLPIFRSLICDISDDSSAAWTRPSGCPLCLVFLFAENSSHQP